MKICRFISMPLLVALAGCGGRGPDSPLIAAARSGDTVSIKTLIKSGANPNETGGVNGWTVLQHAVHKNQAAAVEALLENGADPHARNAHGGTALDLAVNGMPDIDRFSIGECNAPVVRLILEAAPDLASSRNVMSKAAEQVRGNAGCAEVARLIKARQ